MITIIGVDPGLVHTGVVMFQISNLAAILRVKHAVVDGCDPSDVDKAIKSLHHTPDRIFIEGYRPRANFNTNVKMSNAVRDLVSTLPKATRIANSGIKKIVTPDLLKILGAWNFSTPTHHDDLRSAARIAVLGMLKDKALNKTLAIFVQNHLNGTVYTP